MEMIGGPCGRRTEDVRPFHVADDIHGGIVIYPSFDTVVRLTRTRTATSVSLYVFPFCICPCSLCLLVSVTFDRPFTVNQLTGAVERKGIPQCDRLLHFVRVGLCKFALWHCE